MPDKPESSRQGGPLQIPRPSGGAAEILSAPALAFVADLAQRFSPRVDALLARRQARQARFDAGERPDFLPETAAIRQQDWKVAPLPVALLDRRVEITGPTDRKMIINALNSGANVFMADFEDSNTPTWENLVQGQLNLRDAIHGTIDYIQPETGKVYALAPKTALLMVRPRGWHLLEAHALSQGRPIPAALFDFGLYCFHNAAALAAKDQGPFFYLPKLESHLEAQLWNDVFVHTQEALGLPVGTIRATVLIETLPAAFEMDEILYALQDHSAGLNCGRWDYIFSFIKKLRNDPSMVLPDRSQVTMTQHFLHSYALLLIRTCHRRGVHAMGGMAAQIPNRLDPQANETALEKVRADKLREVSDGHDGTWVAHPGLVPLAREIFDAGMPGPNQIDRLRTDVEVTASDLLQVPQGTRTLGGLRHNVRVAVQYLEAWLNGVGCVPLYNLMEDAATAEICRAQVWQWRRHQARLEDGQPVTARLVKQVLIEELAALHQEVGADRFTQGRYEEAAELFRELALNETFEEFLTLPAYERLERLERRPSTLQTG